MARTELAHDLEVQVRRLAVFTGATLLVAFGLQFLVVAGFLALATVLGGWLAALLVSVTLLITGSTLLLVARSRAGAPFLKRTLAALREDLQWFSNLLR